MSTKEILGLLPMIIGMEKKINKTTFRVWRYGSLKLVIEIDYNYLVK